jgi:gamma-glutamylcyclotransferase (GGCT)/AIG2-like uncharacterized protein YtfP
MDSTQMQQRCPAAKCLGTALLRRFTLVVTARGFASIQPNAQGEVWGVLWDLTPADESSLDVHEGVQTGCYRKEVQAVEHEGVGLEALVYIAPPNKTRGRVNRQYADRILTGGRQHRLPKGYQARLTGILLRPEDACFQWHNKTEYFLFVYGTLKANFPNHHLLAEARFLGSGQTAAKYALYAAGIPHVIKNEKVSPIIGELYLVAAATLDRIDQLEDHPHWYCREVVTVTLEAGQPVRAWMYFFPQPRGRLIPSGEYTQNHLR